MALELRAHISGPGVQFLAPTSGPPQVSVTPGPKDLPLISVFLHRCTHTYIFK